ncbi:MAG: adenosylcobinamide-GDP ribazoletransferase [Oscillospiraceae bacterium]|nr:adenosylcobinamide-GDP ribazoletransferase [Oscillospiraceae bacterium]
MRVKLKKNGSIPSVQKELSEGTARKNGLQTAWESFCVAFSLYSAFPMPRVNWTKENMKYAFCFFPLIGAMIGGILILWLHFCQWMGFSLLFAAGATTLPVLLTGGIHMDGFCDVMDALGSHGTPEQRLEIMKDSRSGAFAIIGCVLCLLMTFALWDAFYQHPTGAVFFLYPISRAISGWSVVYLRCAKGSGLAVTFADAAHKKMVAVIMACYLLVCFAGMAWIAPFRALLCAVVFGLWYVYYREKSYGMCNGITGDLAGWFLVICELLGLSVLALIGGLLK